MNIIEAIKERRSIRTFNGEGITAEEKATLEMALHDSFSPFGGDVTIRLKSFNLKDGFKPSTYGMIRGAEDYFMIAIEDSEEANVSAGFRFEQVVLKAFEMGLGTCWVAATFNDSDFETGESWPKGERLRVVCPVGKAIKPSSREELTRLTLGSANRKPFNDLFFYGSFSGIVPHDNQFREALEMMRLAPSSNNTQPWRVLIVGDMVHFYYVPKNETSPIDAGIGIYHFYATEKFLGHEGQFIKMDGVPVPPENWRYVTSFLWEK